MSGKHSNPIQEHYVLEHLRRASITPLEALNLYGIFRLAARIYQLRKLGHNIYTKMITDPQTKKRYAEYYLLNLADAA